MRSAVAAAERYGLPEGGGTAQVQPTPAGRPCSTSLTGLPLTSSCSIFGAASARLRDLVFTGRYECAMERRKPGPVPKGDRRLVNFKLPTHLIEAMKSHAERRGMTATDLVGELLAAEVGVPYLLQEGLPLNKAS